MSEPPSDPSSLTLHLAYAEASAFLLEGLLRLLIERGALQVDEVIQMVEDTIATKKLLAHEGSHAEISTVAAGFLVTLSNSIGASRPPRIGV
jgi:hypothetical protein